MAKEQTDLSNTVAGIFLTLIATATTAASTTRSIAAFLFTPISM